MKFIKYGFIVISIVLFTSSVLAEEFKKPSTAEIESSVMNLLEKGLPWFGDQIVVENSTKINKIELITLRRCNQ